MKQYTIISGASASEVETQVAKLLNEGWKLAGGISVAYKHEHSGGQGHIPGHLEYVQALVKESN